MDDEEKGRRRFLREKDCSALEKWVGRGRDTLDTVVSTATDIVRRLVQVLALKIVSCNIQRKTFKTQAVSQRANMNAQMQFLHCSSLLNGPSPIDAQMI